MIIKTPHCFLERIEYGGWAKFDFGFGEIVGHGTDTVGGIQHL